MYPREMDASSKERDGGGEGKSLAYERGSVRGEGFCVIINRIVSTCTRNVLRTIYENKSCGLIEEMRSKIGEQQICNQSLQVNHSAQLRPYKH